MPVVAAAAAVAAAEPSRACTTRGGSAANASVTAFTLRLQLTPCQMYTQHDGVLTSLQERCDSACMLPVKAVSENCNSEP
eukprot:9390-Heterococcus_DN1.PRE.2